MPTQGLSASKLAERQLPSGLRGSSLSEEFAPAIFEVLRQFFDDLGFALGR
jgi:hypothetical protein